MSERVEIIAIGDELLSGETVDTNSSYLDRVLESRGWRVRRHTTVPDDVEDISEVFREASGRADLVISSGGLGPTIDDVTMEGLAKAMGVGLRRHEPTLEAISARFRALGREMSPNNERQAMVPSRGEVIPNGSGTAPAFVASLLGTPIFVLPGVPSEVRFLVEGEIVRRLPERPEGILRRTMKVVGLGESRLEHVIRDVIRAHPHVGFGFRALGAENHIKMRATGVGRVELLDAAERDVRDVLGDRVFGTGDESLASMVGEMLIAREQTLAVAESCTGGLLSKTLTDEAGASRYLLGSVVAYANSAKSLLLGIDPRSIETFGAVSERIAEEMAFAARDRFGATFGLSTTGIAGPSGGSPEKPVGRVFIGVAGPSSGVEVRRYQLPGDRDQIRRSTAALALDLLRTAIRRVPHP